MFIDLYIIKELNLDGQKINICDIRINRSDYHYS